ncbi:beta-lactamase family protein [Mesorhizobium sp. M0046]|uniref:serine hydrolase n=1 Tax=Mesorhizobium sp. M0046 TaxID=2956858 RepID=UPI003335AEDF
MRYVVSLRAPRILPFRKDVDWTIGERPGVARFLAMLHFSAFIVVRGDRILYEAYAPDFGPDRPHPIMSITKTTLNLGRVVADGLVNLDERVGTYLPEIGTGYAEATIKMVADMDVANDFSEDESDPTRRAMAMRPPSAGACRRRVRRRRRAAPSSAASPAAT